jgi:peptidoglycan/xylan/chitin deacetylase (PgdA/CDA1 family)
MRGAMSRTAKIWLTIGAWTLVGAVLLFVATYGLWQLSRSRDFQLFGRLVDRVETSEQVVALTFDDGPTPKHLPGVLDLLRRKDVKATFFLMGVDVEKNPDLAREIMADGHEIGNHTYRHDDMTLAGWDKVVSEVERTDAAIRSLGYTGEIHFRPPFGKKLVTLPLYLAQHDRTTITWDVEPESYSDVAASADGITQHVLDRVRPGSIIILHIMYDVRETSRQALPAIIDGLHERGYRFVTVSELLEVAER